MCFYTSSTVSRQKSEIDLPCHVWGLFSPPGAPVIQWLLNVLFLFVFYYLYRLFCITVTLSLYLSVCVYKSTNSQYVRFYSQTGFTLEEMYFFFVCFVSIFFFFQIESACKWMAPVINQNLRRPSYLVLTCSPTDSRQRHKPDQEGFSDVGDAGNIE